MRSFWRQKQWLQRSWRHGQESAPAARSRDRRSTDLARFGEVALFDCSQIYVARGYDRRMSGTDSAAAEVSQEKVSSRRRSGDGERGRAAAASPTKAAAVGGLGSRWRRSLTLAHRFFATVRPTGRPRVSRLPNQLGRVADWIRAAEKAAAGRPGRGCKREKGAKTKMSCVSYGSIYKTSRPAP